VCPILACSSRGGEGLGAIPNRLVALRREPHLCDRGIRGHDHFSAISPVTEKIAQKIIDGKPEFERRDLIGLK
jgi:hypothetical protein